MPTFTTTFIADGSGNSLTFLPITPDVEIDNVSLKKVVIPTVAANYSVKDFLSGNMDEGREIDFRADTQMIQMSTEFENFANPLAIVTKSQRGSLVKCFIALGDEDFYELEGNATKGISLVKVHSRSKSEIETPPIAREMRISWRDSSRQLCRLTQGAIIFLPTNMSYTE